MAEDMEMELEVSSEDDVMGATDGESEELVTASQLLARLEKVRNVTLILILNYITTSGYKLRTQLNILTSRI